MDFHFDNNIRLSYDKYGHGNECLFLFHGFGLTKKAFEPWIPYLAESYTIYAVDLFYHGESEKPLGIIKKKDWAIVFNAFLTEQDIDRFSALGFSLGARFAICSAIELAEKCDQLILVAPDAIYRTPWFKAATSFGLKWVFKYFMLNPKKMDLLIKWCLKLRIVSKYMADFVEKELGQPENRRRVYISWNHFKPLGYTVRQLRKAFTRASYSKTIILGTKDIVIPPAKILPLIESCGFKKVELPLKHHQLIRPEIAQEIMKQKKET